uniref:Monooxygenase FAD-binding protein n=1 Tax=Phaselicystis flava TaxID=525924 RepID=A0A3S5GYG3_9BACT|nr:monooxygenase FAD-binding protein [Phaselicystis flava]
MTDRCDVAIVGGGPVGLFLGCLLAQQGVDARVYERRTTRHVHSRAVGVHPPGLACLAEVGVAEPLIRRGVCVRRALAFGARRALGSVSFSSLPGPHGFVLCVPQRETERALEARLGALSEQALRAGWEVLAIEAGAAEARLTVRHSGAPQTVHARFVVGCDGKHSRVREAAGIAFPGGPYREHFMMADSADETGFGHDAAIFMTREGVVESFPLPNGQRRWVVGLGAERREASAALVEALVARRTGQVARAATATMISAFTAERYIASTFARGSIALAGDAAHVISPIGGQGMNLGWLDARLLARGLVAGLREPARVEASMQRYAVERRRAARAGARRAELFMTIGQRRTLLPLRDALIEGMLSRPLVGQAAQLFTMRGLASAGA